MSRIRTIFAGFLTGLTDAVPGVSGATILLLLGFYEKFIQSLSNVLYSQMPSVASRVINGEFSQIKSEIESENIEFITLVGLGIAFGVISSILIVSYLLESYPSAIFGVFTGLIIFSAVVIFVRDVEKEWSRNILLTVVAVCISIAISVASVSPGESAVVLLFSGFIATFGMLLPGLSGSFLLLILGKYSLVVESVSQVIRGPEKLLEQEGAVIFLLAVGGIAGTLTNIRIVSRLLKSHEQKVIAFVLGLVIGGVSAPVREFTRINDGSIELFVGSCFVSLVILFSIAVLVKSKSR